MKYHKKIAPIIVLVLVASSLLLLPGCGGKDVAESQGCPSGSYLANSTDKLIIPTDGTLEIASVPGGPAAAATWLYVFHFVVTDTANIPRNNICVQLYTGGVGAAGSWYSDNTYSTVVTGSGPMNAITAVTNDAGEGFLYWSTTTPAANPVSGTTAGPDIKGSSWIMYTSGVQAATWTLEWTVKGEPTS